MALTTQQRVQRILDEFLSAAHLDKEIVEQFRVWLFSADHTVEKALIIQHLLKEKIVFDPRPSKDVVESYKKIAMRLGFEPEAAIENEGNKNLRRPLGRRIALRIAAVVIPLAFVATGALYMMNRADTVDNTVPDAPKISLVVAEGEKKHTTLPDNSSVWVNSGSEIVYADNFEENRNIKLEGEAFFNVTKADDEPFTVTTDELTATVLGTAFNIDNDKERGVSVISLYEGSLRVDIPGEVYLMEAGQELSYYSATGEIFLKEMARSKPEWMRNIIDFKRMSAPDVLRSIGDIYGYDIHINDPSLGDDIVTLKFEGDISFEDVLSLMSEMSGFSYRIRGNDVYVAGQ